MKPVLNPPNPFESYDCQYLQGMEPPAKLEVYEDATRTILSENKSPDLGFRWSLNPYRGCAHACAYCYARPTHEYLGFGAGTDFETKILVKKNAPQLLRETFMKRSWKGEMIVFSGDTDCYQPLEAHYRLTRGCLEACLEFGSPAGIITKSYLIVRDLELLKELHARTNLWVVMSIPFADDKTGRMIEPGAAAVSKRFEAMEKLASAGIRVTVNIAPVIPAVNDDDIPRILTKAKACGAEGAGLVLLRLPGHVKEVFAARMKQLFPMRYAKIEGRMRQMREGKIYDSRFGKRFKGTGDYWDNLEKLFDLTCERLGLNQERRREPRPPFKRPSAQQEFILD
jgi:DNA repair photolyase